MWLDRISVVLFEARVGILQQKCFNENSATTRFLNFQKRKKVSFLPSFCWNSWRILTRASIKIPEVRWSHFLGELSEIFRGVQVEMDRLLNLKFWFFYVSFPPSASEECSKFSIHNNETFSQNLTRPWVETSSWYFCCAIQNVPTFHFSRIDCNLSLEYLNWMNESYFRPQATKVKVFELK